jgi:biopolymer transport protein ExbD
LSNLSYKANHRVVSEINIINLVDVMMVLLVIFILIAPIMEHGIDVRLPASSSAKIQTTPDSLTVSIAPPGKIYMNNQRVTLDELRQKLTDIARVSPETPLVLRAGEKLDYGIVVKVLDSIRQSGLSRIGIATRPPSG